MGLDMYVYAELYLSQYNEEDKAVIDKINSVLPKKGFFPFDGVMKTEVAYWRKANAIHKWFVDNVQNGEDDCGMYEVSREQLKELIKLCKAVLSGKNKEALNPVAGFFFGGTDKDDYYRETLKNTVAQLTPLLDNQYKNWVFYYNSSW